MVLGLQEPPPPRLPVPLMSWGVKCCLLQSPHLCVFEHIKLIASRTLVESRARGNLSLEPSWCVAWLGLGGMWQLSSQ